MTALAIIIPTLNEAENITTCLQHLAPLRARGVEVIVVDGGSRDETPLCAQSLADVIITVPSGRALQMNAGATQATAQTLLFLHADTRLPDNADRLIDTALKSGIGVWGRFDVGISGSHAMLPLIAWFMNLRSRATGVATGDQGIFVSRDAFNRVGGFAAIALMEDVAICKSLKKLSPPLCLRDRIITSGRRWEKNGALKTILLMWRLRLAYFLGADPERLAEQYYGRR